MSGCNGARRQQVRPDRHVGKRRERRIAEVTLLLNPVGRHRSDLAEHVLPRVVHPARGTDQRLAVVLHVPGDPAARLELVPLIGNGAVGWKAGVVQQMRVRGRRRIDSLGHELGVPSQPEVDREAPGAASHLSWMNSENSSFVDVRGAGGVAGDAVRAAALQVEEERPPVRRRSRRARRRRGHVGAVRAADRKRPEPAGRRRRGVAQESGHAVEDVPSPRKSRGTPARCSSASTRRRP